MAISVDYQKTLFIVGDKFSFGGKIYVDNGNGLSEADPLSATFSPAIGSTLSNVGSQTVTVTVDSSSCTYIIHVSERSIKGGVDIAFELMGERSVPKAIVASLDDDGNKITDYYLSRIEGGSMHADIRLGWYNSQTQTAYDTPAISSVGGAKIVRALESTSQVIFGSSTLGLYFFGKNEYPIYNNKQIALIQSDNSWSGKNTFLSNVSMHNNRIVDLADPVNDADAVNKRYIDENWPSKIDILPYDASSPAINGIRVGDYSYRLVPSGDVGSLISSVAVGIGSVANQENSVAIGKESISPVENWVSFDSPNNNRILTVNSVDNIFIRNSSVSAEKDEQSDYADGYTLGQYLESKTIKRIDDEQNNLIIFSDNGSIVGGSDNAIITLSTN